MARESFSSIYWAAREQRLPWDLWKRLEAQLPWHLFEWDRCTRLIEGLAMRFVHRSWPASEFVNTFRTDEEFDRAVGALVSMRSDSYLDHIELAVTKGGTSFQRARILRMRS